MAFKSKNYRSLLKYVYAKIESIFRMRSTPKPTPNYSKIKKVSKSQKTTYTSSPASKPKNHAPQLAQIINLKKVKWQKTDHYQKIWYGYS